MSANTAELAGNYAMSGGAGDPEFVAEQLAEMQEEQAEAEAETVTHANTKHRLEQRLREQRRTVEVLGEPVEFEPVGAGMSRKLMSLRRRAADGDGEAEEQLVELVFETLADHSVDPEMTEDWWGQFSIDELKNAFERLVMGNLDASERERIEQFRGE